MRRHNRVESTEVTYPQPRARQEVRVATVASQVDIQAVVRRRWPCPCRRPPSRTSTTLPATCHSVMNFGNRRNYFSPRGIVKDSSEVWTRNVVPWPFIQIYASSLTIPKEVSTGFLRSIPHCGRVPSIGILKQKLIVLPIHPSKQHKPYTHTCHTHLLYNSSCLSSPSQAF